MFANKPLVIIPAAGFGTRVGRPEAKELLLGSEGFPLIQRGLDQALKRDWPVHVITRKEKLSLIDFLQGYQQRTGLIMQIQLIEPSREWPDTVLQSVEHWHEQNILCLPDTEYQPLDIWDSMIEVLKDPKLDLVAATFSVKDTSSWGVLRIASRNELEICEKPQSPIQDSMAWGILGFRPEPGQVLLQAQLASTFDHNPRRLALRTKLLVLEEFKDVTRVLN